MAEAANAIDFKGGDGRIVNNIVYFARVLRKAGLKVTLPRVKILQFLEDAPERHMSAEDIYKALLEAGEDVGLATVYRVLTQFEQAASSSAITSRAAPPCSSWPMKATMITWSASTPMKSSSLSMRKSRSARR